MAGDPASRARQGEIADGGNGRSPMDEETRDAPDAGSLRKCAAWRLAGLEAGPASRHTLEAVRGDLASFTEFACDRLGDPDPPLAKALGRDLLEAWMSGLRAEYALATASRRISTMRTFAAALGEAGVRGAEAGAVLPVPTPPRPPPRDLTPDELEAALRPPEPPYTAEALRNHSIVTLIYSTGLRVGEAGALDLEDLRLGPGSALVRVRSGSPRALALDLAAETAAERYLERSRPALAAGGGGDVLYVDRRLGRMNRQMYSRALRRHADERGIEAALTPKSLRRAYARAQLAAGMDLEKLRRRLGLQTRKQARAYAVPPVAGGDPSGPRAEGEGGSRRDPPAAGAARPGCDGGTDGEGRDGG